MRRIGSRNTVPEITVRRLLHAAGYRFRLHSEDLPGKPDIVLPRFRTAIFVNGCFWHGHSRCKRAKLPATRTEFWRGKITRNKSRDRRALADIAALGYKPIVIWQCQLRDKTGVLKKIEAVLGRRGI